MSRLHIGICDARVQRFVPWNNMGIDLALGRKPLAERAQEIRLAAETHHPVATAALSTRIPSLMRRLFISPANINLFAPAEISDDVVARALSYGLAIYGRKSFSLNILVTGSEKLCTFIYKQPPLQGNTATDQLIFNVNLHGAPRLAKLTSIRANGLGGNMVGAMYALLKELGASKITFEVSQENDSARRFYFRIDAGCPVDVDAIRWEIPII